MKPPMVNIEWENVKCHICNSENYAPLMLHGQPFVDGQYGYAVHPVICECGLVFLNPRWSRNDYNTFYKYYYDDLYRLETKPDYGTECVVENMVVIWDRIKEHLTGDTERILDIGCGYGYGLKYLKEQNPSSTIYGIESSPECCKTLQSREIGANLITNDFDSNWANEYSSKFDLIILRHAFEHMLNPVESWKKLKIALSENGFIYISTPDMLHPRTVLRDYEKWWEYWFRAVHPYYYCKGTLFKTLEFAGLYPLAHGEENEEVWCLTSMGETEMFELNGVYREQKKVLDSCLK